MEVSWEIPKRSGVHLRRGYQLCNVRSLVGSVGNVGGDDGAQK